MAWCLFLSWPPHGILIPPFVGLDCFFFVFACSCVCRVFLLRSVNLALCPTLVGAVCAHAHVSRVGCVCSVRGYPTMGRGNVVATSSPSWPFCITFSIPSLDVPHSRAAFPVITARCLAERSARERAPPPSQWTLPSDGQTGSLQKAEWPARMQYGQVTGAKTHIVKIGGSAPFVASNV